ncbi:MAG: hypothetical protein K9I47_11790, partial [Bacteroidales bacterium]|nr:hypothetical protein [Bacteroidales bacterium]
FPLKASLHRLHCISAGRSREVWRVRPGSLKPAKKAGLTFQLPIFTPKSPEGDLKKGSGLQFLIDEKIK